MCLAFPGRVISVDGDFARVDFGLGVMSSTNISLVDAKIGEYVLVHAGYAIQVLNEKEAKETLEMWKTVLETEQGG